MSQPTRVDGDATVVNVATVIDGSFVDRVVAAQKPPGSSVSLKQLVACCVAAGVIWRLLVAPLMPLGYVGAGVCLLGALAVATNRSFH